MVDFLLVAYYRYKRSDLLNEFVQSITTHLLCFVPKLTRWTELFRFSFFLPKICFMCLGDVNLYFGGSSGNRGFLGPGCSDLPFLEPDILEKVTNFKTDILEKVKHFKTPQNLQACYNSTHSLSLYASRHHQKSLTHPTFQPNYFAFSLRPTQLCHNNHNGYYQYRWFWRLLNEMLDWGHVLFLDRVDLTGQLPSERDQTIGTIRNNQILKSQQQMLKFYA